MKVTAYSSLLCCSCQVPCFNSRTKAIAAVAATSRKPRVDTLWVAAQLHTVLAAMTVQHCPLASQPMQVVGHH